MHNVPLKYTQRVSKMAQQVKELAPSSEFDSWDPAQYRRQPADNSHPWAATSPLTQDTAHSIDSLNISKINYSCKPVEHWNVMLVYPGY